MLKYFGGVLLRRRSDQHYLLGHSSIWDYARRGCDRKSRWKLARRRVHPQGRLRFRYVVWSIYIAYIVSVFFVFILVFLWIDQNFVFGLIGKDVTGRTEMWSLVIGLMEQRPPFGWGYRAMWEEDDTITEVLDDLTGNWGINSAHNVFLEIILELGMLGLFALLLIIGIAFWRGLRCSNRGIVVLGWVSLTFFMGAITADWSGDVLGLTKLLSGPCLMYSVSVVGKV